jgi:Protein of unknown function (DUF3147)
MRLRLRFDSLKETTPREYVSRFVFGGAVTVVAGLISEHYGPVVGGLFLAFPGILPSGISLVEKHKQLREKKEGKVGVLAGRAEASVEATGASIGAIGLVGFATILWHGLPSHRLLPTMIAAFTAWIVLSLAFWWIRERI